MAHAKCINVSHLPSVPWKNGSGNTKEIAAFPENAGLDVFIWRVSVAEINRPSAYSLFPEIDRTQILIAGERLTLRNHNDQTKRLLAYESFSFAGEQAWFAEPEGDCQMLNVMTSRNEAISEVEFVCGSFEGVGDGRYDLLFVVQGEYICKDASQRLVCGDFLQPALSLGETFALSASPDALMIAIKFSLLSQ